MIKPTNTSTTGNDTVNKSAAADLSPKPDNRAELLREYERKPDPRSSFASLRAGIPALRPANKSQPK